MIKPNFKRMSQLSAEIQNAAVLCLNHILVRDYVLTQASLNTIFCTPSKTKPTLSLDGFLLALSGSILVY